MVLLLKRGIECITKIIVAEQKEKRRRELEEECNLKLNISTNLLDIVSGNV